MLHTTINDILQLKSYQPSEEVNYLFTRLVRLILAAPEKTKCDPVTLRRIQVAASEAESEMEIFWANAIINSPNPVSLLKSFPYIDNYELLVRREVELVEQTSCHIDASSKILVVGSGPLPLTAYKFIEMTNARVDHLDSSLTALRTSEKFMMRLGYTAGYIHAEGATALLPRHAYDVVLVAGLAGQMLSDKQRIIDNILPALTPSGRIVVRTARGSRALLYPEFTASDLTGVLLLSEYHPDDEVINSVFIYGKGK